VGCFPFGFYRVLSVVKLLRKVISLGGREGLFLEMFNLDEEGVLEG
jgi:hypothetical protein